MLFRFDDQFYAEGIGVLCGVDEAGRGPLAGPVVAAAVVLPPEAKITGLRDSKELTPKSREEIYDTIVGCAAWATAAVEHDEIDRVNILVASLSAMKQAVQGLSLLVDLLLVDGMQPIPSDIPQLTLIRGDKRSAAVAAASVIAKVTRDRIMRAYHEIYPAYNFADNKGYGTREHLSAIRRFGPCPIHRQTFSGVKEKQK
jgi:ribonuclease HII